MIDIPSRQADPSRCSSLLHADSKRTLNHRFQMCLNMTLDHRYHIWLLSRFGDPGVARWSNENKADARHYRCMHSNFYLIKCMHSNYYTYCCALAQRLASGVFARRGPSRDPVASLLPEPCVSMAALGSPK